MKPYPKYKDSGVEWIGKMPEGWSVLRLKWVCNFLYGKSLSAQEREDGTIPVYGSNGIVGYHNRLITEKPCIIVGRKGSFGKVTFSEKKCYPIDTTYYIDCTSTKNYMRWLWYLLPLLKMDEFSRDSAVPGLNREDAYRNIVTLPSSYEQKQIAAYLDRKTTQIDNLISKKQKLIELLKKERATIINQAVTKGLNPDAPMKDSGIEWLGEIPAHWKVVGLTKYLESTVDYRGRTPEKTTSGVFLVTAKNLKNGKIDYSLSEEFVSEDDYDNIMRRGLPEKGDVLFTTEAPLGEVANVDEENIALAQRIIKFRPQKGILNCYFLKYWLLSPLFQNDLQSYSTGSTALGIKASKLNKLRLVLPLFEEQKKIVIYINQKTTEIDQTVSNIENQIELLQEYRTALISEVVTGKIDVRDEGSDE